MPSQPLRLYQGEHTVQPPTQTQSHLERSAVLLFEAWLCGHEEVGGEAVDVGHHTVALHGVPKHADDGSGPHSSSRHSRQVATCNRVRTAGTGLGRGRV